MIPLPNAPKIIKKENNFAVVEISPCWPGYSATLANSFRRVLLSSLEGAAITQIKVNGAGHEFASLNGVLEDIVVIMLNLKKIRLKSRSEEPQLITLKVKGEKKVKAGDFKMGPYVEIANPELHIATLTDKNAQLEMEAVVETGSGYETAEEKKEGKSEVGVVHLDAIYTPVKKVSFKTENVRVGKKTNFEKILLNIETDGTITPQEAFLEANKILFNHFSVLSKFSEEEKKKETKDSSKKEQKKGKKREDKEKNKQKQKNPKKVNVEDMKISERTKNILEKGEVKSVGGLTKKSEEDLLNIEGFGDSSLEEVKKALKSLDLSLRE